MDSSKVLSRPKRSLIDKPAISMDAYTRNRWQERDNLEKNQTLKNNRIRWDSFFLEDEKLTSYFMAAQMTGNFFGIAVPTRYPVDGNGNNAGGPVPDLGELKLIFNTAHTVINYFKLRYSHKPDLIKAFVESTIYLTPNNIMGVLASCLDFNRDEEEKPEKEKKANNFPMQMAIPNYASDYLKNWEFLHKINNELMALERTAAINYPYFFYQVLYFYYYDQPLITRQKASEINTARYSPF